MEPFGSPGLASTRTYGSADADGTDPKFNRYVPEPGRVMVPQVREKSVQEVQAERLETVRKKQAERDVASLNNASGDSKRRRLRSKGPEVRG